MNELEQVEVLERMRELGLPSTRANYLAVAFGPNVPQWTMDLELELPHEFRAFDESKHPRVPGGPKGGEFTSGGGGGAGKSTAKGTVKDVADVKLTKASKPVFEGQPVPTRKTLNKQETGKVGEEVGLAYVRQIMKQDDARIYSLKAGEKAVDMIGDHMLIEVKAGLVSNSSGAQQWRATEGEPGEKEKEWRKTATKEEKAALGRKKQKRILQRKQKLLDARSKELGVNLKPATLATIINPDSKSADVFMFDGFHLRIGWNSDTMKKGYVGSYKYG